MIFVLVRRGIFASTITLKLHDADCDAASLAEQSTAVVPTGNGVPGCRVHVTTIGVSPPDVCGALNVTGTGAPVVDVPLTPVGHVIDSGGGAGGVAAVGEEHPARATTEIMTAARMRYLGRTQGVSITANDLVYYHLNLGRVGQGGPAPPAQSIGPKTYNT